MRTAAQEVKYLSQVLITKLCVRAGCVASKRALSPHPATHKMSHDLVEQSLL